MAWLVQQVSRTPCANATFGYDTQKDAVWIRGGCRGIFACRGRNVSCGFNKPLTLLRPSRIFCSCSALGRSIRAVSRLEERSGVRALAAVAVCITGLQRTLLELPVRRSFQHYVRAPLVAQAWRVDPHIVISVPQPDSSEDDVLRQDLQMAYEPKSLTLLPASLSEEWVHKPSNEQCAVKRAARWQAAEDHGFPSWYNLRQWFAIGVCYDAVESVEKSPGGRQYDWLVRLRSDMAFFETIPLAWPRGLDTKFAYVLSHGMSSLPHYRCMNDHAFLCPRLLCRPFFKLLELWTSPFCRMQPSAPDTAPEEAARNHSIFVQRDGTLRWASAAPDAPFDLPLPPTLPWFAVNQTGASRTTSQWFFFARYSDRAGRLCRPTDATEECCGLLRELAWPSTIGRSRLEGLDCAGRLAAWWAVLTPSHPDYARRPSFHANASVYIRRCEQMQIDWQWGVLEPGGL